MSLTDLVPMTVTNLEMAFPAHVDHLMPAREAIPDEFQRLTGYWSGLVNGWFFNGLDAGALKAKPGVDKLIALRHLQCIMGSYEPKHEHKIAAVAYLMSLWFEAEE
jgi:hypothetical protein